MQNLRIWDLPTRLFHWALVVCVVTLFVTGNVGGNWMTWHIRAGYGVLTLLTFRLVWGCVGGHWSRFGTFVPTPGRLLAYLRPRPGAAPIPDVGHSPLGALSVMAMLLVLTIQVGTGLVSDDEIAFTGPLVAQVSGAVSAAATTYHKEYGKLLILGLVALHVCAIVFYRVAKGRKLTRAMVTGDQTSDVSEGLPASADSMKVRLLALVILAGCAGLTLWVSSFGV
jgi:cytochrome b